VFVQGDQCAQSVGAEFVEPHGAVGHVAHVCPQPDPAV
jgi:hypothetical protein